MFNNNNNQNYQSIPNNQRGNHRISNNNMNRPFISQPSSINNARIIGNNPNNSIQFQSNNSKYTLKLPNIQQINERIASGYFSNLKYQKRLTFESQQPESGWTNAVLYRIVKEQLNSQNIILKFYMPGYFTINVLDFKSLNVEQLNSQCLIKFNLKIYYGDIPIELVDNFKKQIQFIFQDKVIKASSEEKIVDIRIIEPLKLISYSFTTSVKFNLSPIILWQLWQFKLSSLFLYPYQKYHQILKVSLKSVKIKFSLFSDKLQLKIRNSLKNFDLFQPLNNTNNNQNKYNNIVQFTFKVNLMDSQNQELKIRLDEVSYPVLGQFLIADKIKKTNYSNSKKKALKQYSKYYNIYIQAKKSYSGQLIGKMQVYKNKLEKYQKRLNQLGSESNKIKLRHQIHQLTREKKKIQLQLIEVFFFIYCLDIYYQFIDTQHQTVQSIEKLERQYDKIKKFQAQIEINSKNYESSYQQKLEMLYLRKDYIIRYYNFQSRHQEIKELQNKIKKIDKYIQNNQKPWFEQYLKFRQKIQQISCQPNLYNKARQKLKKIKLNDNCQNDDIITDENTKYIQYELRQNQQKYQQFTNDQQARFEYIKKNLTASSSYENLFFLDQEKRFQLYRNNQLYSKYSQYNPESFQTASFDIPIFRQPFIPIIKLVVSNLILIILTYLLYQSNQTLQVHHCNSSDQNEKKYSQKVANTSAMLVGFVAYIQFIRQQVSKVRHFLLIEILAYIQIIIHSFCLMPTVDDTIQSSFYSAFQVTNCFLLAYYVIIPIYFCYLSSNVYQVDRSKNPRINIFLNYMRWKNSQCDVYLQKLQNNAPIPLNKFFRMKKKLIQIEIQPL